MASVESLYMLICLRKKTIVQKYPKKHTDTLKCDDYYI